MSTASHSKPPATRTPWSPIGGLRIGTAIGALIGGAITALTSFATIWVVAAGAVLGGVAGYMHERRKLGS